jgi:arsenate reductase
VHWGIEDPARAEGEEIQQLEVFRRVRDDLRQRIGDFLAELSV